MTPTFYSQGNGNYRDVNQNRRNDVWFNEDVKANHLLSFLSLSQADGYNPLIVKGSVFTVTSTKKINQICYKCVSKNDRGAVKEYLRLNFTPGELLKFVARQNIRLSVSPKIFLNCV